MSSNRSEQIKITHVINPHLFWFKYVNKVDYGAATIEQELEKYVAENRENMCATKSNGKHRGELYAVYMISEKKWIRAKVDVEDELIPKDELIVWAIDYGIPIKTSLNLAVVLNSELKKMCDTIKSAICKGGISNILPALCKKTTSNVKKMVRTDKWDSNAVNQMERMLNSPLEFNFASELDIENHLFGRLEIQKGDKKRFVSEILQEQNVADEETVEKFTRAIGRSNVIQIDRWLNNDGNINCVENKCVVIEERRPTKPTEEPSTSTSSNASPSIDQNKFVRSYNARLKAIKKNKEERENRLPALIPAVTPKAPIQSTASTVSSVQRNALAEITSNRIPSPQTQSSVSTMSSVRSVADIGRDELINNLKLTRILTHNNSEEPIDLLSANFTESIFKGMNQLGLKETYVSQGYAWPNLLRGNSLVLVDSQNRGKTIAYLPAVCSLVQRTLKQCSTNKMGTTVIIVCLTASVPKIATMCRDMLQMQQFMSKVIEARTGEAVGVTVKLYNGCNILVTTAPCLKELLQKSPNAIKTDKLKCIAFENIDCIMKRHPDTCNEIINELCLRKAYKGEQRQIMVTSRTWIPILNKFLNETMIADSVLLIGNYLEAALWGKVILQLILCTTDAKLDKLTEQVLPIKGEKTMIICNEIEEAEQVANHLKSKNVSIELVKNDNDYATSKVKSFWAKMDGVVICTDEHLEGTQIKDAQHIFHFSIPQEFLKFLFRFSTMLDYYGGASPNSADKQRATSTIFIDNQNNRQLPKFVDLLKRDGQNVDKEFIQISERARMRNTEQRAQSIRFESICNYVFMHGTSDHSDCPRRHMLLSTDILPDGPNKITHGTLRFHVLDIISPTEYIIRPTVLQIARGQNWRPINGSDEFVCLDARMHAYYQNADNLKNVQSLKPGEKCVVERYDKFYRGEIIKVYPKRNPADEEKCDVRLLDFGEIHQHQEHKVYVLDESFQMVPYQAFNLHLTSIVPADNEDDWDPLVYEQVKRELNKWTQSEQSGDLIYEANVLFALRNVIVVDCMRLFNLALNVVNCSLKNYLSKRCYGIFSDISRKKVIEMAKNAGVKVVKPKEIKKPTTATSENISPNVSVKFETRSEVESTYSDTDTDGRKDDSSESACEEETIEKWSSPWKAQHKNVEIALFNSPTDFYVTQKSEELQKLYEAIDEYARDNIESAKDESMNSPDVEKCCLVQVNGHYHRGKIFDVVFNETQCLLQVYLVDIGQKTSVDIGNVFEIPSELIEMLPFQAIWCNLIGIQPVGGSNEAKWTEELIDNIYDSIDEYGNELFLHTISEDKTIRSELGDPKLLRYDIVLLAVRDRQQININEMLVSMDLAEHDPITKSKLRNIPSLLDDDDDEDNDDGDRDEDWEAELNEYQNNSRVPVDHPAETVESHSDEMKSLFDLINNIGDDECFEFCREWAKANDTSTPKGTTSPALSKIEEESELGLESNSKPIGTSTVDTGYLSDEITEASTECSNENVPNTHQLEYIYKRPKVCWSQTAELLVLRISAHDNVKYGLEITPDHLIYGTTHNDEQIVAVINFFGSIECDYSTHEIRGLNVIVRLRKSCPIMWPHLLLTAEKCSWVTQSMEAFSDEEMYSIDQVEESVVKNLHQNKGPKLDSDDDSEYGAMAQSEDEDEDFSTEEERFNNMSI